MGENPETGGPVAACQVAMVNPITDDEELAEALMEIVQAHFGS